MWVKGSSLKEISHLLLSIRLLHSSPTPKKESMSAWKEVGWDTGLQQEREWLQNGQRHLLGAELCTERMPPPNVSIDLPHPVSHPFWSADLGRFWCEDQLQECFKTTESLALTALNDSEGGGGGLTLYGAFRSLKNLAVSGAALGIPVDEHCFVRVQQTDVANHSSFSLTVGVS